MANLRVLYNNVADLAAVEASNSTANYSITNVQNIKKTSIHRSSGSSVTYTLTWTEDQSINGVALPATNLISGATIRVTLYNSSNGLLADSNTVTACKDKPTPTYKGLLYTANTFPYVGATKTSVWFNSTYNTDTVRKVIITVTHPTAGYPIDCSRIVCGKYWESSRQVSNGINIGITDNSIITNTRSGDSYVDRKPINETMQFQLQYLTDTDRKNLLEIMKTVGSNTLVYYCIFPDNTNPEITQNYSIYGRNSNNSIDYALYNLYNSSLNINGW